MTVSTEISSNEYTGNGVTTDFDYKFRIFKASDLSVTTSDADGDNVVTLRLGTDYTVTEVNKSAGGKVLLTRPLADKHQISITRVIPIVQETSFRNQGKFLAETHEDAFDYLTMIVQRIWGSLGSLYLKRPNILSNWFDAKGYRIANLGKPKRDSDVVDLGTLKDEINGVNSTILKREKRLLRVDDIDIAALPKANDRAGNVLTFDKDGKPIVVAPASGSAVDVLNKLAGGDGSLIGVGNGTLKDAMDWVTPQMFGAVGDGIADDTDALQAAIDYCAPFEWQGSVAETKKQLGKIKAYIRGFGKFRITRPILLSPFLVINCGHNGGFYGSNGGFQIIADFDAKDLFAVDTAPYNSNGERVLGYVGSRTDWDDGKFSGCMGWLLRGVSILVTKGRNLRGALNRCMAAQSWVFNCSLTGGNVGVSTSVSWGGGVQFNQITARAIALLDLNDTTIDYQSYNYLSIIGAKPSSDEFSWPDYPYAQLTGKTTLLFSKFAHPIFEKNILEGGQIGAMISSDSRINLDENYIEGSSFEYVVAAHSVQFKMTLRYLHTPTAGMFHLVGATASLDAKSVSYLNISNWGVIDEYSSIKVSGAYIGSIKRIPWNKSVQYIDIDTNGERVIYLSENGSDTNSGFLSTHPVLTVQEAIDRCDPVKKNKIIVTGNVSTKYTYSTGSDVTRKVVNVDEVGFYTETVGSINVGSLSNEVHSLPMGIRNVIINSVNVVIPKLSLSDYRPFIPCLGQVDITVINSNITGGALMGCKYQQVGHANLVAKGSTLACDLQDFGSGAFSWIDTAFNTSVAGGSIGRSSTNSKKISSFLYP